MRKDGFERKWTLDNENNEVLIDGRELLACTLVSDRPSCGVLYDL